MGGTRSIPPSNYASASLDQMRGWLANGPGAKKLFDVGDQWFAEQRYMNDLADRSKEKLKKAGVEIESRSGEAMQNAMAPVTLWTEVAADNAYAQGFRAREQANSHSIMSMKVPDKSEEMPVPSEGVFEQGWENLTGGRTDQEIALAHNEKLRQDGVAAYNTYDGDSQGIVAATPVFQEPPKGGQGTQVVSSGGYQSVGSMNTPYSGGGNPAGTYSASAGSGTYSPASSTASNTTPSNTAPSNTAPSNYVPRPSVGSGTTAPASSSSAWTNFTPTRPVQPWQRGTLDVPGTGRVPGVPGAPGIGGAPGVGAPGQGTGSGNGTGTGRGAAGGRGSGTPVNARGRGVGTRVPIKGLEGLGAGGRSGFAPRAAMPGMSSSAASSSSATARGGMMPGAARGGQGGQDEEEHETPEYLKGDYGYFDDDLPRVAPPVIE